MTVRGARAGLVLTVAALSAAPAAADPALDAVAETDRAAFTRFYLDRFPGLEPDDFVLGVYAVDAKLREQYDAINEFPPYEFAVDEGEELASAPFANGKDLGECLELDRRGVNEYPYFDEDSGEIITLAVAVNTCRTTHGEPALDYRRQTLSKILAFLNLGARGTRRDVRIDGSEGALSAYERGKAVFYTKRGRLNLSCADCHMQAAGRHLREQTLAPLLGAVNHYPVYGLSWGALGTLHQRFVGCFEQVRADAPFPQSPVLRDLEYFLAIMSNGLPMTGPGIHR